MEEHDFCDLGLLQIKPCSHNYARINLQHQTTGQPKSPWERSGQNALSNLELPVHLRQSYRSAQDRHKPLRLAGEI